MSEQLDLTHGGPSEPASEGAAPSRADSKGASPRDPERLTGNEYANLIAAYLTKNYGPKGLLVYREVSLGKSIIGKNRKIDILAVHTASSRALGIECKFQGTAGTADEKIPYTLQDLEAMHVPAFVAYAGSGFSVGVTHMLESHKRAAYCLPTAELSPSKETVELDHVVAMTFGWWELVLGTKKPFAIESDT